MQIEMLSIASGPDWQADRGQIVDRPEKEAQALIEGGYAKPADGQADAKAKKPRAKDDDK